MAKNKKKKKNPIPSASNFPENESVNKTVSAENEAPAGEAEFEKELSSLFEEQMESAVPLPDEDNAVEEKDFPQGGEISGIADIETDSDKEEDFVLAELEGMFSEETENQADAPTFTLVDMQHSEETDSSPDPVLTPVPNVAEEKPYKKGKKKNGKETNKTPAPEVPASEVPVPETPEEKAKPEKSKKKKQKKDTPKNPASKKSVDEGSAMYLLRLVLVLTAISAVIAGMLAVVNYFTEDIIAENTVREKEEAVLSVFPEGDSCKEYRTPDGNTVYFAASGDYAIGYCVNVSPSGYSGDIDMMVGIGSDGSVAGIKIVSLSETPGVGTKVNSPSFLSQFLGRTNSEALAVGENVDGIGGATFSSKAVTAGVSEALSVSFDFREAAASVGLKVSDSVNVPNNVTDANDDNGDEILMPDEVGEVEENETTPAETSETSLPEETEPVEMETQPIQSEIEAPTASEIEPKIEEPEETLPPETTPVAETLPPETTPVEETLPPETTPVEETLPPETAPVAETLPPETAPVAETLPPEITEPEETEPEETDDIIVDVEIIDHEPEETEEPADTEEEQEETEEETKKNNSSNKGSIIIR